MGHNLLGHCQRVVNLRIFCIWMSVGRHWIGRRSHSLLVNSPRIDYLMLTSVWMERWMIGVERVLHLNW